MPHEPKPEEEQEDSFWTVQFSKEDRPREGIAGYLVPASSKEEAIRLAEIHSGNHPQPLSINKSSVHKAHAYDIAKSDIVTTNFEDTLYIVVDEHIDGEIRTDDLKNY